MQSFHSEELAKKIFEERHSELYPFQKEIFDQCVQSNKIVFLPTGAGKTVIAAVMAAYSRWKRPNQTVIMLVNRVPLVSQQAKVMRCVSGMSVGCISGDSKDAKNWQQLREQFHCAVMIDAIFLSWMNSQQVRIEDIGLLILDEVHHAKKNANYSKICDFCCYKTNSPQILGLTASPGADLDQKKTMDAIVNLIRTTGCTIAGVVKNQADLLARVPVPQCSLISYRDSPEERHISRVLVAFIRGLEAAIARQKRPFCDLFAVAGFPLGSGQYIYRCREVIINAEQTNSPHVKAVATALSVANQAYTLLEECGAYAALHRIFDNVWWSWSVAGDSTHTEVQRKVYAELSVAIGIMMPILYKKWATADSNTVTSTKLQVLEDLLSKMVDATGDDDFRAIVFTQTKSGADKITKRLNETPLQRLNPRFFVGHSKSLVDDGPNYKAIAMTDVQQRACLEAFRNGDTKLLIATSVAEEGLDIPICNLVVRYDGHFTLQSFIQSRGRARKHGSRYFAIAKVGEGGHFHEANEAVDFQARALTKLVQSNQWTLLQSNPSVSKEKWERAPVEFLQRLHNHPNFIVKQECIVNPVNRARALTLTIEQTLDSSDNRFAHGIRLVKLSRTIEGANERLARQSVALILCQKLTYLGVDIMSITAQSSNTSHPTYRGFSDSSVGVLQGPQVGSSQMNGELRQRVEIKEYRPEDWTVAKPLPYLEQVLRKKRCQIQVVDEMLPDGRLKIELIFQILTKLGDRPFQRIAFEGYPSQREEIVNLCAFHALKSVAPIVRRDGYLVLEGDTAPAY